MMSRFLKPETQTLRCIMQPNCGVFAHRRMANHLVRSCLFVLIWLLVSQSHQAAANTIIANPEFVFDQNRRVHATTVVNSGASPIAYEVSVVLMLKSRHQTWLPVKISERGQRLLDHAVRLSPTHFRLMANQSQVVRARLTDPHLSLPAHMYPFVQIKEQRLEFPSREGLGFSVSFQHRLPIQILSSSAAKGRVDVYSWQGGIHD